MHNVRSVTTRVDHSAAPGMRALFFAALFGLCFVPPARAAKFTIQPYLQEPGPTTMTVMWELDSPAKGTVTFQKGKEAPRSVTVTEPVKTPKGYKAPPFLYVAKLTGLTPATKYTYSVKCGDAVSKSSRFKTFPKKADRFTFIAYGDSRSRPEIHKKLAANFRHHNAAFIVHSGDYVVNGRDRPSWKAQFFEPLKDIIDHIPLFGAWGNHEKDGVMLDFYFAPSINRLHHSFDYGNAHFNFVRSTKDEDERAWHDKDLAATKATWKFAIYHVPSFNIGGKGGRNGQTTLIPLLRKHRVDMTLTGDSHIYERFHPLVPLNNPKAHPITHIVSGGGGAPLYGVRPHPCVAKSKSMPHFLVIEVKPDSISIDVRMIDDTLFESFTINKKNGVHDEKFLASVMPEEAVILTQKLRSKWTPGLEVKCKGLPSPEKDVEVTYAYIGDAVDYPVNGVVTLSDSSKEGYVMEPEAVPFSVVNKDKSKASFRIRSKAKLTVSGKGDIEPGLSLVYRFKVGRAADLTVDKGVDLTGALNQDPAWQPLGRPAQTERNWSYRSFVQTKIERKTKYWAKNLDFPKGEEKWSMPAFDAGKWKTGKGPIGKGKYRYRQTSFKNAVDWGEGNYLMMRTTFELDDTDFDFIRVRALAANSYALYLNGHRIHASYRQEKVPSYKATLIQSARKHLVKGKNVLAALSNAQAGKPIAQADFYLEGLKLAAPKNGQ